MWYVNQNLFIHDIREISGKKLVIWKWKAVVECPTAINDCKDSKENVTQGAIYRHKLCGIVTDKVNENISIRNIEIKSLIFVDDIMFSSSRKKRIEKKKNNWKLNREILRS